MRMQAQLVLHQRMIDDVHLTGHQRALLLDDVRARRRACSEHGPVALDDDRGRAVRRRSSASRRPAAQVPPSSMAPSGRLRSSWPEQRAHPRRQPIEQRHRERPPLHHDLVARAVRLAYAPRRAAAPARPCPRTIRHCDTRPDRSARRDRDVDAGRAERLEQRVGQPLRELVERHELGAGTTAAGGGWRQTSPSGTPSRLSRPGQIEPSPVRTAASTSAAGTRPPRRRRAQGVEQVTGPRLVLPNRSGVCSSASPRARSSAARPSRPASGLSRRDLEALARDARSVSARSAAASARHGVGGVGGEDAAGEQAEARHRQALRAAVRPGRSRAS